MKELITATKSLIDYCKIPYFAYDDTYCIVILNSSLIRWQLEKLKEIDNIYFKKFHVHFVVEKSDISVLEILKPRMQAAKEFYVDKHGAWVDSFLEKMGDELSRISFKTFMDQRIMAKIIQDRDTCFPVNAPVESADWREKRLSMQYDLPRLEGCSDTLRDFFYHDTYILEQYAIEDVISAEPGDTVIDCGAFVGDTSIYFSRKVGENGKVFAFEILPENVLHGEHNLKINNCNNTLMINKAVSDSNDTFYIVMNSVYPSMSYIIDAEKAKEMKNTDDLIRVESITLDDFVQQNNIKVDYLNTPPAKAGGFLLRLKSLFRLKPVCFLLKQAKVTRPQSEKCHLPLPGALCIA